jgi:uncharacterized protein YwqG
MTKIIEVKGTTMPRAAKKPVAKITDIEVATAVIAHEAVDCFSGKEQKKSKQPKQLVSSTGGAFWGKRGEEWPRSSAGKPLFPWLQIVCTEMKRLYGAFYGKQAVCFYLSQDFSDYGAASSPDHGDLVVREYETGDRLVPLARPSELVGHDFHRVTWTAEKDYPALSKYYELFESGVYHALCDPKKLKHSNRSGLKIGGWPTPVQGSQEYPGASDLQIDMTENWSYMDSGIAYLSRTSHGWGAQFETM